MRDSLRQINKIRARFRATVAGFDQRTSYGHPKPVDDLGLQPGDEIEFDARVGSYVKGYADDRRVDYKLNHPTRIIKRSAQPAELPLFSVLHL
jgi:hypothetical protein